MLDSTLGNRQDRLAMNEKCNVGPPYAYCDRRNYLVPVPNGNPGSSHGIIAF